MAAVPLQEWERGDKTNVEIIGYGWEEKRVMVRLHLPADRDQDRIQLAVMLMLRDIKHSKKWLCEFCGAPLARETHTFNFFYRVLDSDLPRLVVYCHFVCDMDERHVREGLTATHNLMNTRFDGTLGPMPPFASFGKRPSGKVYPLAGSCAGCQHEDTAVDEGVLKRCARCKMTRVCGAACQRADWGRHKVACGMIYSVTFENWG